MSEFVDQEFGQVDLGDRRRDKRLRTVLRRMLESPREFLQSAMRGWAETMGCYRLLHSPAVTHEAILEPHRAALTERVGQQRRVAMIQDTTELDFTSKPKLEGAGPLNSESRRGFLMHTQLVIGEGRLPLGVWHSLIYARDDADFRAKRKHLPIEEKESLRWIEGYRMACELAAATPGTQVVSISDSEGDIYEMFDEWNRRRGQAESAPGEEAADWIIRASRDRALLPPPEEEGNEGTGQPCDHLYEEAEAGKVLGEIEFDVPTRKQRKKKGGSSVYTVRQARRVRMRIRVREVTPRPPRRLPSQGARMAPASFRAVLAEETDPPEGQEPLRWLLLTSLKVECLEDALEVIELYVSRWEIEIFFRVLKTGCRVEEIQLKSREALLPCLALYQVVAWRILYLMRLGRACPDLPCGVFFEEDEWQAALAIQNPGSSSSRNKAPPREPTLGEMVRIVAGFGGHLGRKGDHPPGAQTLWQGLSRVRDFAIAWRAFGAG